MARARWVLIGLTALLFAIILPWNSSKAAVSNGNADLQSISLDAGELSPAFSPSITEYWVTTRSTVLGYSTTATPSNSGSRVEYSMNGGLWLSLGINHATGFIALFPGDSTLRIKVTSTDETVVKTYTVHVQIPSTNDATLSQLRIGGAALSPTFQPDVTAYTANVPYTMGSMGVTGKPHDAAASLKINGNAVSDGTASASIPLNVGSNTITVQVRAYDSITVKTYTLTVVRAAADTHSELSGLAVSAGELSPGFHSGQTVYALRDIGYAIGELTVTPTVTSPGAAIKARVNGGEYVTVDSGMTSVPLALNVGTNTIQVKVTAQNGVATTTYEISAVRKNNDAWLSGLTASPGELNEPFSSDRMSYTLGDVDYATETLTVTPTLSDPLHAFVHAKANDGEYTPITSGFGVGLPLVVGANTIDVEVIAEDTGFTKHYTITVNRKSGDAWLSGLSVSPGGLNEMFSKGRLSYTMSDAYYAAETLTVTPTLSDPLKAFVHASVNGGEYVPVTSGFGVNLPLAVGPNTIDVEVIAEDASVTKRYTISVKRKDGNAWLSGLAMSPGELNEPFSSDRFSYTMADAGYGTERITITPTLSNPLKGFVRARVNDGPYVPITSGYGMDRELAVGSNIIEIEVYAEDMGIMNRYTVSVHRKNGDASLGSLAVAPGGLNEPFFGGRLSYSMPDVNYAVEALTITPSLSDPTKAVMSARVNNGVLELVASGTGITLPLAVGYNLIEINTVAEDTSSKRRYTISVNRKSAEASLSGLTVTPGALNEPFSSDRLQYTSADADYAQETLAVSPTLKEGAYASLWMRINGSEYRSAPNGYPTYLPLAVGLNTIDVKVAPWETGEPTKVYTLQIARRGVSEARLEGLTITPGSLDFSSQVTDYNVTVGRSVYAVTVKPSLALHNTAAIQVNINGGSSVPVTGGTDSPPLTLVPGGLNTVQVRVAVPNGPSRVYTIRVAQAGVPTLSGLTLEGLQATLTFSEPLLRSVTEAAYYTVHNVTRNSALSVTDIVYGTGSPEVGLTLNGLALPGDELEFRVRAGAVVSLNGEPGAAAVRTLVYKGGDSLAVMRQRLADLDTDHNGIQVNEILAYMNQPFGRSDLNGDSQFTEEDVFILLSELASRTVYGPAT